MLPLIYEGKSLQGYILIVDTLAASLPIVIEGHSTQVEVSPKTGNIPTNPQFQFRYDEFLHKYVRELDDPQAIGNNIYI